MIKLIAFFGVLVALAIAVEVDIIDRKTSIPNRYIVQFYESTTDIDRNSHFKGLTNIFVTESFENVILSKWNIGSFHAYSAQLSQQALQFVRSSSFVKVIEQDAQIRVAQSCAQQSSATWGIDRVAADSADDLDGVFRYSGTAGSGVDSYVLDTGINIAHDDFDGRAIWGINYSGDGKNSDCNGHGTHVAGTMGGTKYGVAKKTTLFAVKVLDCDGSGSYQGILDGIEWTVNSYISRKNPSVANMSLGGGKSTILNAAVDSAVDAGVVFVVAAGNENDNSCDVSPASAESAITVGATGMDSDGQKQIDNRAYFSNYGACNDIFAPGLSITSAWIGSTTATKIISGTSMASPHIAGVVALYLADHPSATPAQVATYLTSSADKNVVHLDCSSALSVSACEQTKNHMVHHVC